MDVVYFNPLNYEAHINNVYKVSCYISINAGSPLQRPVGFMLTAKRSLFILTHTKHRDAFCGQNKQFCDVKADVTCS
jgi:hypothetical protein